MFIEKLEDKIIEFTLQSLDGGGLEDSIIHLYVYWKDGCYYGIVNFKYNCSEDVRIRSINDPLELFDYICNLEYCGEIYHDVDWLYLTDAKYSRSYYHPKDFNDYIQSRVKELESLKS